MNFSLNEDQTSLLTGLDQLLAAEAPPAPTEPVFTEYAHGLDAVLSESGFLDIAREDGFGLLDAALIVERLARLPQTVEAASTAIIAPALGLEPGLRPVALTSGNPLRAARYLPMAKMLIVDRGDDALILSVDPARVAPVETLFAYPYGRLTEVDEGAGTVFADVALLRRVWRIALAAEAAGCMASAVATVSSTSVRVRPSVGRSAPSRPSSTASPWPPRRPSPRNGWPSAPPGPAATTTPPSPPVSSRRAFRSSPSTCISSRAPWA